MTLRLGLTGLLLACLAPQETTGVRVAVRAGWIHPVSGPAIENGTILIRDGKIEEVRPGHAVPAGYEVIDATGRAVVPGLIDVATPEEADRDAEQVVAADVRALDGFDFFREERRLLAGGVTTVFLSPGNRRLISGQGAVVKTAGADRDARVLSRSLGLKANVGDVAKDPPDLYKPPIPPSADRPIEPVKRQAGATRMGQFAELRRALESPKSGAGGYSKEARQMLTETVEGRRPVFVTARPADDLVRMVRLADEYKFKPVLMGADEAAQVADLLVERKIPVWLDAPLDPVSGLDREESRFGAEFRRSTGAAAALRKAGVTVALQSMTPGRPEALLLVAGYAGREGLGPDEALRLVTLGPAEILGVADRIGSLEKGKDADLAILDGPLTAAGSAVRRVLIQGRTVFERTAEDDRSREISSRISGGGKGKVLAIRGARLWTGTQGIVPEGLILITDGKITYAGKPRPVPEGAEVVDAAGLTAIPGFIDAHSFLGLGPQATEDALRRGGGREIPSSLIDVPSAMVRLSDPVFRDAAEAGVTAALIAPEGSGVCSLIKTGGGERSATILKDLAALKVAVTGGPAGLQAAKDLLTRARKYHEEWDSWERHLKEQPKGAPSPSPAPGPAPAPVPASDPLTGTWKGSAKVPDYEDDIPFTMEMTLSGSTVTGTITATAFGQSMTFPLQGTFVGSELKIDTEAEGAKVKFTATVGGGTLQGKFEIDGQGMRIVGTASARRVGGGGGGSRPAPVAGGADRKEPARDDTLEPYRCVFRREIPLLVVARDVPAIENASKALAGQGVDWTLVAPRDSDYAAGSIPQAVFGPDFLRERRGTVANLAEALVSSGIPVCLGSLSATGSRHLPLVALHAVRNGLDPEDALKSLTVHAARCLNLEGRLGAIERGRDGDVVLLTGDPFDLSTRVRLVVTGGRVIRP